MLYNHYIRIPKRPQPEQQRINGKIFSSAFYCFPSHFPIQYNRNLSLTAFTTRRFRQADLLHDQNGQPLHAEARPSRAFSDRKEAPAIMRYIGGKSNLLAEIGNMIASSAENVHTVIDIFSGSGAVSSYLKEQHYHVIGNDILYFSYVLSRGTTGLNAPPAFDRLGIGDPVGYLNALDIRDTDIAVEDCFVYQHYSPHGNVDRMYFQNANALKIDIIRITIENWKKDGLIDEDGYFYLLAALIAAVPYVSNIAGVYGAYLKHWDARTYHPLLLKAPKIIESGRAAVFYNQNCDLLLPRIAGDLLYADPPYNSRQYLPNYHVLETIARYDYPEISGVTGMRDYRRQKSDFCTARGVEGAFRRMIERANVRYVLISYNSEGLLAKERLSDICREYAVCGTFQMREIDYRRYKNASAASNGVTEQLYFFEKNERNPFANP